MSNVKITSTASIIVMSHLSDAQLKMDIGEIREASIHIQFAKYIILMTNDNLTTQIDPDELWNRFNKNYLSKVS